MPGIPSKDASFVRETPRNYALTLFKNMVFFGNFFLIYISAMCANEIVEFVSGLNISMYIFIIILNIIGATILAVISFRKISKLDNESVVRSVGQWI